MAINTYILKIGGADLTDYICYGGMTVAETPVYDETETTEQMYADAENTVLFTAVSGKKIYDTPTGEPPSEEEQETAKKKKLKGKSVSISATAEGVPSDVAAALFAAVDSAKLTNSITIEYAAPVLTSAEFEYPTITSEISAETEDETEYDLKISADCPLIRFGEA